MEGAVICLFSAVAWLHVSAQQTTSGTSPPNCICPPKPAMGGSGWQQTNGGQIGSGMNNQNGGQPGGPGGMGPPFGMGPPGMGGPGMGFCDNFGRNYSDPCALVNAQYSNPNLGKRPCGSIPSGQNFPPRNGTKPGGPWGNGQPMGTCMTDGQFLTSKDAVMQYLQANPSVGIRGMGSSSPCTLQCPGGPGGMGGPRGGMMGGGGGFPSNNGFAQNGK